jgi:exodeoxyribonuclease VII large subunit
LPRLQDLIALPRQRFDAADRRLSRALLANTRVHATRLARIGGRLSTAPLVHKLSRLRERLLTIDGRAGQALGNRVGVSRRVLEGKAALLKSLSYQSVLARGFALVRDETGLTIRRAKSIAEGALLSIEFADGKIGAVADGGPSPGQSEGTQQGDAKTPRPKTGGRGGQGSLF